MKIKVSEATPIQLDWLVATIEAGAELARVRVISPVHSQFKPWVITLWDGGNPNGGGTHAEYATAWKQGGPIIEREKYRFSWLPRMQEWCAQRVQHATDGFVTDSGFGSTMLIAAMRCFVTSELGEEVEVPDELA